MTTLLRCSGGTLCLPPCLMISREDGGHLQVDPPRQVWDRSELSKEELIQWSFLVAASGKAMLEVLPQLREGVINYWEAGNWALNKEAEPKGIKKIGCIHKKVHMHLLGRSPHSNDCDWQWGEAPRYPTYLESSVWCGKRNHLTTEECSAIAVKTIDILVDKYNVDANSIQSIVKPAIPNEAAILV